MNRPNKSPVLYPGAPPGSRPTRSHYRSDFICAVSVPHRRGFAAARLGVRCAFRPPPAVVRGSGVCPDASAGHGSRGSAQCRLALRDRVVAALRGVKWTRVRARRNRVPREGRKERGTSGSSNSLTAQRFPYRGGFRPILLSPANGRRSPIRLPGSLCPVRCGHGTFGRRAGLGRGSASSPMRSAEPGAVRCAVLPSPAADRLDHDRGIWRISDHPALSGRCGAMRRKCR